MRRSLAVESMDAVFVSGRIVDLILAVMALEAIALIAWRRLRGHGPGAVGLLVNLGAGACLLLALRACLVGAGWPWIALWLALAFCAHAGDLWIRLRAR